MPSSSCVDARPRRRGRAPRRRVSSSSRTRSAGLSGRSAESLIVSSRSVSSCGAAAPAAVRSAGPWARCPPTARLARRLRLRPRPSPASPSSPPRSFLIMSPKRLLLGPRWSHRPEALAHDRLLHDRPQVRGDPVDEQAGRELPHEEHEEERQRQEDHPLRLVGRRRHQQRRRQLRADVEHDQDHQHVAVRAVRQIRDEEELRVAAVAARNRRGRLRGLRLRADVVPEVRAQHVVQRQEDRELRDHREARGERVHLVLPVELHHLLVEALLVVLVALLQLLDLGLRAAPCDCIDLNCLSVSGSSACATRSVSATIARPQPSPTCRGRT